ncbi:MAG: hypothetical protein B6D56_01940 [Candidatus Omnitrophica bacterium 4484_70.1]|nr:MAG: hypothetical protein B6D56_01940 [Candidatus Omnitrophica bacterium 4484_70.1]
MGGVVIKLYRYKTIIFLLLIFIIFLLITKKIYSDYRKERKYWEIEEKDIEKRERLAKEIKETEEEFLKLKKKLLPPDIFYFKKFTEEIATKANVKIETFRPLSSVKRGEWIEFKVNLKLTCSYQELVEFVSALEKMQVIEIESLVKKGKEENQFRGEMILVGLARKNG